MRSFDTDVHGCARCGRDHEEVTFEPFVRPVRLHDAVFTHWAPCPHVHEPILCLVADAVTHHPQWPEATPQHDEHVIHLLDQINRKASHIMADLTALQASVDSLATAEAAAAGELQALVDEIAALEAGDVTQEQIDAITTRATQVADALNSAVKQAQDATDGDPATPPV